jgi:hypothetical protein
MSGHLDQAAAVLTSAAGQVPVETLLGADSQLGNVAQYIQQAGGQIAESLVQKTLAMQDDARQFTGRLAALRQEIETAAAHVLASGS